MAPRTVSPTAGPIAVGAGAGAPAEVPLVIFREEGFGGRPGDTGASHRVHGLPVHGGEQPGGERRPTGRQVGGSLPQRAKHVLDHGLGEVFVPADALRQGIRGAGIPVVELSQGLLITGGEAIEDPGVVHPRFGLPRRACGTRGSCPQPPIPAIAAGVVADLRHRHLGLAWCVRVHAGRARTPCVFDAVDSVINRRRVTPTPQKMEQAAIHPRWGEQANVGSSSAVNDPFHSKPATVQVSGRRQST